MRKGVYPYEYMNDWEFNETSLPGKEHFYSHLNMEDITDVDYVHTKRVCKDLEIKHLGEYHDLYVQSNTLLSADVFENFRNICIKIYELDPAKISFSSRISMTSSFKKEKSKIKSFNWYRYVINGKKMYKRRNMSIYLSI